MAVAWESKVNRALRENFLRHRTGARIEVRLGNDGDDFVSLASPSTSHWSSGERCEDEERNRERRSETDKFHPRIMPPIQESR